METIITKRKAVMARMGNKLKPMLQSDCGQAFITIKDFNKLKRL